MQVSTTADVELGKTQRVLDTALFGEGGHCFSSRATAYQPGRDGGLGHINIAARMRAEWAQVAIQLAVSQEAWVEVWKEELRSWSVRDAGGDASGEDDVFFPAVRGV